MVQWTGSDLALSTTDDTFIADMNELFDALFSQHAGASMPAYLLAGGLWTNSATSDYLIEIKDAGGVSRAIGQLDDTNNVVRVAMDADRDSWISALTDDEIRVRLGGVDQLDFISGGIKTLGNQLDLFDKNGAINARFDEVTSAVNYFRIWNSSTGNSLWLAAAGTDANIDINLVPFGAGNLLRAGNQVWDAGNDGAGSGLDADLWDGLQRASAADTATAKVASGTPTALTAATWTKIASVAFTARSGAGVVVGSTTYSNTSGSAAACYTYVGINSVGSGQAAQHDIPTGEVKTISAGFAGEGLTLDASYTAELWAYSSVVPCTAYGELFVKS